MFYQTGSQHVLTNTHMLKRGNLLASVMSHKVSSWPRLSCWSNFTPLSWHHFGTSPYTSWHLKKKKKKSKRRSICLLLWCLIKAPYVLKDLSQFVKPLKELVALTSFYRKILLRLKPIKMFFTEKLISILNLDILLASVWVLCSLNLNTPVNKPLYCSQNTV